MHGAFLLLTLAVPSTEPPQKVTIEEPFRTYLLANPVLMETPGAKVVALPNGNYLVLGMAAVPLADSSVSERLQAEKVCREKALRDVVGSTQGVQIASVQKAEDRVIVTLEKGVSKVKSVSD